MGSNKLKIAIIGAGPAGLACAAECERLGVIPDIFEKDESVGWPWPCTVDLAKYGLSKGELESVKASVGLKNLINCNAKEYKLFNLQYLGTGSVAEEILYKNPKLYKSPIVRNGKQATVGYEPDIWKDWE